jgi:phosphohistidine phosphatase
MKTIYLVRHAKASLGNPNNSDLERPLLEKGLKRTKRIIDFLHSTGASIDLIISSHAVRAMETAKVLAYALNYPIEEIKEERAIYFGDADKIADQFYDVSPVINNLMVIGHNPAITNFANFFLTQPIDYLSTSGVVCIELDMDRWDDILTAKHEVKFLVTPKMLKKDHDE